MTNQYVWKPTESQLLEGYQNALYQCSEPATAMQHVLHSMYLELMVGPRPVIAVSPLMRQSLCSR